LFSATIEPNYPVSYSCNNFVHVILHCGPYFIGSDKYNGREYSYH